MRLRTNIYVFCIIVVFSCNSGFDKKDEKRIFSEILNSKIISEYPEKLDSGYIVYPYYTDFNFSDFLSKKTLNHPSRKEIEKKVFSKLDIDENQFAKIRNEINLKCKGVHSDLLGNLSIRDKSHMIITFSGLNDNLVFINLYLYHNAISKETLIKDFDFSDNLASVDSFVAFLDSEEKLIQEVVYHDGRDIEFRL